MKTRTIIIMAAVLAVAVQFGSWAWTMSGDGVPFGREGHRVFAYGLPFVIRDCPPELSMRTPTWQVPFRVLGNFAVTFLLVIGATSLGRIARPLLGKAS